MGPLCALLRVSCVKERQVIGRQRRRRSRRRWRRKVGPVDLSAWVGVNRPRLV